MSIYAVAILVHEKRHDGRIYTLWLMTCELLANEHILDDPPLCL